MRVHYYQCQIMESDDTLDTVLQRIAGKNLVSREMSFSDTPIIAEHVSKNGELYDTDFTLRRMTGGPGLAARGEETRDFQFNPGEGFGEQTAVVWSPKGYAAIQYNHRGPKSVGIANYIGSFLRGGKDARMEMTPYVDPDIWTRFVDCNSHLGMECTINAQSLTEEMAEGNITLEQALLMRQATGMGKLKLSIFYGQDRPGGDVNLFTQVKQLFERREVVESLKVKVRNDVDAASELLNLFGHQDSDDIPNDELDQTEGRRYTRESRLREIRLVFEIWLQES